MIKNIMNQKIDLSVIFEDKNFGIYYTKELKETTRKWLELLNSKLKWFTLNDLQNNKISYSNLGEDFPFTEEWVQKYLSDYLKTFEWLEHNFKWYCNEHKLNYEEVYNNIDNFPEILQVLKEYYSEKAIKMFFNIKSLKEILY